MQNPDSGTAEDAAGGSESAPAGDRSARARDSARLETELRQLAERLATTEQRYRTLFDQSPDALIVQSMDGRVVEANRAAANLFVRNKASLVGSDVRDIVDIDDDALGDHRAAVERDGRAAFTSHARRADGTAFPAEVELTRLDVAGEPGMLLLVRDITERQRVQAELLQAQKMEAIGQLVAGVAHELNNPLAAIVAFSQLIRRDERLPDDLRSDAELLTQEADRTRRIVQNLLDFARQRPPERHPTSLRALVDGVLSLQSYAIGTSRVTVEVDIPPELPPVEVDRAQMQQVVLNLTLNAIQAIRATGRPGNLWIRARELDRDGRPVVRISILDDGPGVAPEERARLFLPFFTTKQPGEGTGLGLSVSFGIVAGHGGALTYAPGPGDVGAEFSIELPLDGASVASVPSPGTQASAAAATNPQRPAGRDGEGGRVLVLDDEPSIRVFLSRVLRRAGYEAVLSADGRDAIAKVRADGFAAVLCDHRMAGMSGIDVYEAVVALRPELARRFVFMSGDVLNPGLRDFASERDVPLLAKPFDIETAQRAVRDIIARAEAAQPR